MRVALIAFALLISLSVPAGALVAQPSPVWPTAEEIQQEEPGVRASDAACIARYYHGRLSRKAWHTQYFALTRAQKIVQDAGFSRCLTLPERIATTARTFAAIAGPYPELQCVAGGLERLSRARRLAQTTAAIEFRDWGNIFRACRLTGVLYASVGSEVHLALSRDEQACANRVGPVTPVLHRKGARVPMRYLKAIGAVFDRCVGRKSEETMYRYLLRNAPLPAQIPCLARRSAAALTFAELLGSNPSVKAQVQKATVACATG